jgi:hypothetical protein
VTEVGGLDLLLGWALFGALLAVLGYLLLRRPSDPRREVKRHTDDPPADRPVSR